MTFDGQRKGKALDIPMSALYFYNRQIDSENILILI
jgi:hypothetical protein